MQQVRLAAAVLTLLFIAACAKVEESEDGGAQFDSMALFDPVPINPADSAAVPFPFNGFFSGTTDATLNIPNPSSAPFVTAANLTDGFSTTASLFCDLLGFIDYSSLATSLVIFEADATPRVLVQGVDYTVQPSYAIAQVPGSNPAVFLPIFRQRSRVLIEPLKPLAASTTYLVGLTTGVENLDGGHAIPSASFRVVRSDTPVAEQTDPYLDSFSDTQKATLEAVRAGVIRPTVEGLMAATGLAEDDFALAWSFTTQSVTKTMQRVADDAAPQTIAVANTTISTGDLGLGLADTADIYAGIFGAPYYLANSGGDTHSTAPLTTFWLSDPASRDSAAGFLGTANACAVLAQSTSTTVCFPKPLLRTTETIPVLVAVPNANSGQTKPDAGWPVVIFQHGITGYRSQMLAIAPTLAAAGFVTVAIDLPLHGITDSSANPLTNPFYRNQLFTSSPAAGLITDERTFNLDLVNNTTGAAGPDGTIDSSGTHFINLSSLITSRDNLRQAEADLIHLATSMGNLDLDNNPGALTASDIDETRIHFAGISLGAIAGTTVLGVVDDTLIQAGSLNVPGGGVAKLLDASATFGPRIAAGLGASGVLEGTDTYETFLRFAQHLVDPADPVNYAVAANAGHALQMMEVVGDTVVPNRALSTCATEPTASGSTAAATATALLALCPGTSAQDETLISGYLSGTQPLYELMGLTEAGPITPPGTAAAGATDTVVRFATGTHGSLLTPAGPGGATQFIAVTCEMQRATAQFLATNGTSFQIGGTCP